MRHGRFGGVFPADLPPETRKRLRAARAMISPARREKPCTSTGAGGVIGSKDGCSPPCLSVGDQTNSFHPRNAVDHSRSAWSADASRMGKRPAREGRHRPVSLLRSTRGRDIGLHQRRLGLAGGSSILHGLLVDAPGRIGRARAVPRAFGVPVQSAAYHITAGAKIAPRSLLARCCHRAGIELSHVAPAFGHAEKPGVSARRPIGSSWRTRKVIERATGSGVPRNQDAGLSTCNEPRDAR